MEAEYEGLNFCLQIICLGLILYLCSNPPTPATKKFSNSSVEDIYRLICTKKETVFHHCQNLEIIL